LFKQIVHVRLEEDISEKLVRYIGVTVVYTCNRWFRLYWGYWC